MPPSRRLRGVIQPVLLRGSISVANETSLKAFFINDAEVADTASTLGSSVLNTSKVRPVV